MVNYLLMISADLENLTDLQPEGGCDDPDFTYRFKLKCGNCGEVTHKETCVSLNETVPSAKGKSDTHLAQKCKFCDREGTVTMITRRGQPLTLAEAENGEFAPLMLFDCRGYEPVDFSFDRGWKAESALGALGQCCCYCCSRMGIHRLCFGPYTYQRLQEIITSRLKGIDAFDKQAVEFASRKVAAISGVARWALEICRLAAEIADYRTKNQFSPADTASDGTTQVGMADVKAAIQEMFQAPHVQVIQNSSKLVKMFLAGMVHELYKAGMSETTFEKLAFTCTSNSEQFTHKALEFVKLPLATQKRNDASYSRLVIGVVDKTFDTSWDYFCDPGQINSKVKVHKVFNRFKSLQTVADQHGNTCAAVAAGYYKDTDYYGITRGTVRGSVPRARIALYECEGLHGNNLCDGIIAAALDGVDVISCSVGPSEKKFECMEDSFAKGEVEFFAMSLGTLVATVCCGVLCVVPSGNYGDEKVINYAPWELCVGSCNTYSTIVTRIILGDMQFIQGFSINLFQETGYCPLVLYDDACDNESGTKKLSRQKAENKIIIYDRHDNGEAAKQVKAAGCIFRAPNESFHSYVLPAACVSEMDYYRIVWYMEKWKGAVEGKLCPTAEILEDEFPVLKSYSSRGQSPMAHDLIKPDICAPGQLLVPSKPAIQAWAEDGEKRCHFLIAEGTSFATAVVAGAAAHVKHLNPSFSPAAIKSALLTTARTMKIIKFDKEILGAGSGVINVAEAASVYLVYDIQPLDYIGYLRWLGFDIMKASRTCGSKRLRQLAEDANNIPLLHPRNLNLPNFAATFGPTETSWEFPRKLKHVRKGKSYWYCKIARVQGLKIDVKPGTLDFDNENDEKDYILQVEVLDWKKARNYYGFQTHLEWCRGEAKIRSVIRISRSDLFN